MAQPVTLYRWDDVGAPQIIDALPTEYLDVFYKCLVEGYGAKAPLGWTRPFYSPTAHASVFRNSVAHGGSGGCVKIYREGGGNNPSTLMRITHAADMTGISTFTKRGFTQSFNTLYGTSSGYEPVKWVLIGTPTAFYFFAADALVNTNQANYGLTVGFFAGDYFGTVPNDACRFISSACLIGDNSSPNYQENIQAVVSLGGHGKAQYQSLKIYSADNHNSFASYGYFGGFQAMQPGFSSGAIHLNTPPNLPQVFSPVFIGRTDETPGTTNVTDRLGINIVNSTIMPLCRGVLPGIVIALYQTYRDGGWSNPVTIDGKLYFVAPISSVGGSNVFINLEEWNDPFI